MSLLNFNLKKTTAGIIGLLFIIFPDFSLKTMSQEQPYPLEFKKLTLSDGLPDLTIHTIFQDKLGFLWLGTGNGLVRYDGYTMVTYKPDKSKPGSISGREVQAICDDNDGNLWIGTEDGGLNRYDRDKDTFSNIIDCGIRYLHKDKRGCIWYITNEEELHFVDCKNMDNKNNREFKDKSYKIVHFQISGMTFYTFYEDSQGLVWFSAKNLGLVCYNPDTGKHALVIATKGEEGTAEIRDICEDKLGILWISTRNGQLKFLKDRKKNEFATIDKLAGIESPPWKSKPIWKLFPDNKNRLWLTSSECLFCFESVSGKVLYHFKYITGNEKSDNVTLPIYEDKEGRLWLISRSKMPGIVLLKPDNSESQTTLLSTSLISSLFQDQFGILWIGAEEEGLFKYMEPPILNFRHFIHKSINPNSLLNDNVTVIYESPTMPGTFWIGTKNGLAKFDNQANTFAPIDFEKQKANDLIHNQITAIYEDSRGMAWIGVVSTDAGEKVYKGGLYYCAPGKNISIPYNFEDISWDNNWIIVMHKDKEGMIWMGTRNGLYLFDPYNKGKLVPYKNDINNLGTKILSDNEISVIYEDKRNTLWIGTYNGGLNKFNKIENNFEPYSISDEGAIEITAMVEDNRGNFWIGTSIGFYLFDPKEGKILARFTVQEGLPNDRVNGILEDDMGNLWISTGGEFLSKFNPQNKEFSRHYNSSDKLWEKGAINIALKSSMGEFFLGGKNGFHIFNPKNSRENNIPPQLVLTNFRIFDRLILAGDNSPLQQHISTVDRITLSNSQKNISFDYAVIHFLQPDQNRCRYKLESRDKNWITARPYGTASYNDLSPGEYIFRIKGANGDNVWNSQEKTIRIIIKPPFWNTLWFKMPALFLVMTFIILYLLNRASNKHLQITKQKKNLEKMVARRTDALKKALDSLKRAKDQLVQAEKMAALGNLTAGIAHEIKNPINFVVNFAELSEELSAELQSELEKEKNKLPDFLYKEFNDILIKLKQNLGRIGQQGNKIDSIVNSMLLQSRGKKGEFQEINLNSLIKENTELVYHSMRAKDSNFNVRLEYEFDNNIGNVRVVPQDFSRVILNIINNACYAANEKKADASPGFLPIVRIKTKNHDRIVEIIIWDNGTGIPQSQVNKIFAPYYTTKPVGEGTGLGLSIARDIIIREHKGEIKVNSIEGKFTEFIVTIPKHLNINECDN